MPQDRTIGDVSSPRYDPESGTYQIRWDGDEDRELGTVVVKAVVAVADRDHTELTPLNDVVDPQALENLSAPKNDGTPRIGGRVTFDLANHEVTVRRDGVIVIDPHEGGKDASVDAIV